MLPSPPPSLLPYGVTMRPSRSALLSFSKCASFLALLIACLFVIASPLLAQQAPVLVTQAVDNSVRTVLPGNVHPLARAEFDQGEAPSDLMLHRMLLVLKRSDQQETALRRLIENQQNKKSASYHQWLTPVEFGAKFGPADSDIAAVTNWLLASGFQVTQVSNGRTVIEFDGTAGQVKQAFGTAIHSYIVKGEPHWANASNPSIPTALAPVVAGVNSLSGFRRKAQNIYVGQYSEKTRQLTSPNPNIAHSGTCGPLGSLCNAVGPYDFATIYDLLPLWNASPAINGTGQTIAIVGDTDIYAGDPTADPPIPSDAVAFWNLFGLDGVHAPQPTLNIITNGPDPGYNGDEPEADIDTQWSGAAAPGATIDFVTSADTDTVAGIDLSAIYIIDNNLAPVMSESYGECEAGLGTSGIDFYGNMWEQAAAQGITVMVSSGDSGSAGCDYSGYPPDVDVEYLGFDGLAVNGIASTPWNVAVGGTDFNQPTTALQEQYWNSTNAPITQESAKGPIPETTWNNSCTNAIWQPTYGTTAEAACNNSSLDDAIVGGGGGASGEDGLGFGWMKPTWQTGSTVPNDNARDLPDVSLFASNGFLGSFYVICQSDQTGGPGSCTLDNLGGYGGTSVASPAFAGIMALVDQEQALLNHNSGAQGNANLVLYNLASHQPTAFHDVPVGSTIAMPCVTGTDPDCITKVGTDNYGILSGWATTANYDLATGLGSVDAANLVNKWGDVSFTPTNTTLSITVPTNTTHGTKIAVSGTVTPSAATGDVSLLVAPGTPGNPGIQFGTLSGGTVSGHTTLLPGGTYSVIAHYGGDTTYGGSYSPASAQFTINPESSSVAMNAFTATPGVVVFDGFDANGNPIFVNSNSVVYGTGGFALYYNLYPYSVIGAYWLRADVLNSAGSYCNPQAFDIGSPYVACPTGTVSFTDTLNGNLGTFAMNSAGFTEDQAIQLTGGSHTVTATYTGDKSYNASHTTATITVTPATTAISNVATSVGTVAAGTPFNVTATVTTTSYGAAPTGTVSFYYGATLLGTAQTTPTNGSPSAGTVAFLAASLTASIPNPNTYNITATYSGDGNYTAVTAGQSNSVPITVTAPTNFTLSASPASLSIVQGANGTSTITITSLNSFSSATTLSASGLPSGVTAAFSPNPVTPPANGTTTSILTLTASATATTGAATVTITGTSGSSTATTTIVLTVTGPPSFTLSASPASVTITPTLPGGTSTITVNPTNGFTGSVTLAATGLPTGVTASFATNPTTSTSVLTLTAGATASAGTATVTITGTSGSLAPTTTIALTVTPPPNFTLSASPASVTITPTLPGGTSTITVNPTNGFTGSVTLTAAGLPTGVTASFATNPTTSTSVLTLTASNSAAAGTATVTITGKSGSLTPETTTVALTVNQNFAVSTPTTPSPSPVLAGEPATSTFSITADGGAATFTSPVTFACNLPSGAVGINCGFSTVAAGATSPQTVTVTINTTGPNTSGGNKNLRRRADNRSPLLPLGLPLAGIVFAGLAGRKMSKYSAIVALCASLVLLGLLVACGSSSAPAVGVSVSPEGSTLYPNGLAGSNWPNQTASFTAMVTNSTQGVTWAISPSNGGSITPSGLTVAYTAPTIAVGLPGSATITATSQADSSKVGTATVTITPTTVPTSIVGAPYSITVTATEGPAVNTTPAIALTVQ